MPAFPHFRHRRSRAHNWSRELMAENHLVASHFILPVFIRDESLSAFTPNGCGIQRYLPDEVPALLEKAAALGIQSAILFPVIDPALKDAAGKEALSKNSLMTRTLKRIKQEGLPIGLFVDIALDPYTSHGHDGILINQNGQPIIDNDKTLAVLAEMSLILADAGADVLSPSDMMDGRVTVIRRALDDHHFQEKMIASYSAKYASCFYGPFRDILGTKSLGGLSNKKTYQMDPRNKREALSEIAFDIQEGADMIIIKPGLPYLDVISKAAEQTHLPIFAYQVSGEYAMIKAAAQNGYLDEKTAFMEVAMSFKRAGTRGVITYAALEMAQWLKES